MHDVESLTSYIVGGTEITRNLACLKSLPDNYAKALNRIFTLNNSGEEEYDALEKRKRPFQVRTAIYSTELKWIDFSEVVIIFLSSPIQNPMLGKGIACRGDANQKIRNMTSCSKLNSTIQQMERIGI
ncbi:unnamed protein product [Calypogeia fissa]